MNYAISFFVIALFKMLSFALEFGTCRRRKVINVFLMCVCFQGIWILYKAFDQGYKRNNNIKAQQNEINDVFTGYDE